MNKKGFTLIELLVVIAIIGILSAIVVTFLASARGGAKDASVIAQLNNLRTQASLYLSPAGDPGTCVVNSCAATRFTPTGQCPASLFALDSNITNLVQASVVSAGAIPTSSDSRCGSQPLSATPSWVVALKLKEVPPADAGTVSGSVGVWWCVDGQNNSRKVIVGASGNPGGYPTAPVNATAGYACN